MASLEERKACSHGSLWSSGSCPSVMVRCKPRPTYGDFPACLTHSRLPPAERAHYHIRSAFSWFGDHCRLPPCSLRMAISLPGLPPFSPLVPGGSSCRGPGDRGLGLEWDDDNKNTELGKASLAGFIVNQELKKRISREKCPVLGL